MKLDARRVSSFLRDPGPARVVLLHGEDEGLVRERADALTRVVAGALDDPFRVAFLSREDHGRLALEASAIAMLGGRRVVRVRDAVDALAPVVAQEVARPGDSLIVLEAGAALPARSKLRALVEQHPAGAAIACYPEEGKALADRITAGLGAAGIGLDPDALAFVMDRAGSDAAATRGEIEKLILYAGGENRLTLEDVRACVGDAASVAFDEAVFAATAGDVAGADRALDRAFAEGASPVAVCRSILGHFMRLHQAAGAVAAGTAAEDAVRALRPPVFFKRQAEFTRALRQWPLARVTAALSETRRVELACKQTGAPDTLLVRRLLLALARQGARA